MSLNQAIKEAYAAAPTDEVVYDTLEFAHTSFASSIYVVRGFNNITATLESPGGSVEFVAFPFDIVLPEIAQTGAPEFTITIDNVSAEIVANLELAVASTDLLYVTYRPYLKSDLSAPQMDPPMTLIVDHIEVDVFQVRARAGWGDIMNATFPNELFTTRRFPGLA